MAAKSSVYEHYDIPDDGKEGTYKAKCKYCSIPIPARGKTMSNLVTHVNVNSFCFHHKKIK